MMVKFVKRIDRTEESYDDGDEYRNSSTRNREALDIVEQEGQYYLVRTKSYYSSSYDQYESPMYTSSQRCTLQICPMDGGLLEDTKAQLLAFMEDKTCIWSSHDYGVDPNEEFVTAQVEKALKKHDDERRIAERKARGECVPNAVHVSYSGAPTPKYIDDFSPEGLAAALGCDEVKVSCLKDIAFFQSQKIVYGIPYNRVATSILGVTLEGPLVVCGCKDGQCAPLSPEEVEELVRQFLRKKAILWP